MTSTILSTVYCDKTVIKPKMLVVVYHNTYASNIGRRQNTKLEGLWIKGKNGSELSLLTRIG